jgi:hypothetical protein
MFGHPDDGGGTFVRNLWPDQHNTASETQKTTVLFVIFAVEQVLYLTI